MKIVGKVTQEDASGYDQIQLGTTQDNSTGSKNSTENQESRSDKNLRSASSTATTDGTKASIAFNLSFTVKIANRTPFDPSKTY